MRRHPADRPAVWIISTLLVWCLVFVIFSGDWTILAALETVGAWLRAIPGPTEHWATILSAWAWPIILLILAWRFSGPLGQAMHSLARRFGTDDVEILGLKLKAGDSQIPLDSAVASKASSSFSPDDVAYIERLYEFAGKSAENAGRLRDWISDKVNPKLDPIDFMSEPAFAPRRRMAYQELIGD